MQVIQDFVQGIALHYNPQTRCIFVLFDYESSGTPGLEARLLFTFTFQQSICLHVGINTVTEPGNLLRLYTTWGRRRRNPALRSLNTWERGRHAERYFTCRYDI
jgi:hypothetical protein